MSNPIMCMCCVGLLTRAHTARHSTNLGNIKMAWVKKMTQMKKKQNFTQSTDLAEKKK